MQVPDVTARATKLIFVEGVIGSGKSTTANFIARQLQRNGVPARYIFEGGHWHPTRLMADLPHPFEPWLDVTPGEYRARSLDKWRAFVARTRQAKTIAVFDGQLFHGNMTDLLLMDSAGDELSAYVHETVAITKELNPLLIYLYQVDLEQALRRVFAARGHEWERYQVNWKLRSPYAERRGLTGLDGLITFYREYRATTDELGSSLAIDTLSIENSAGEWPRYRKQILAFLSLPPVEDTDISWRPARLPS